jgi:non-homologous end joining protein Ku
MKMIKERVESGQLEASPEPAPKPERAARGQVVDLMALLKRSVDEGGKPAKKAARKPARKAARKPAHRPAAATRRTGSAARRKSA